MRSFDLARGEEGQSHLDVYFNDRLVLSTKGRAGQSDSLDARDRGSDKRVEGQGRKVVRDNPWEI